jgi:superfamily II DNA or RNA helicase
MSKFITNFSNPTFLDYIKSELQMCDSFYFSVSFIKDKGLQLIKDDIENSLQRGAKGYILTSSYQNFTDIQSLKVFLRWMDTFDNFTCHIEHHDLDDQGFHSKGYMFTKDRDVSVILGSSNITYYALRRNVEWNLTYKGPKESELFTSIYNEFFSLWHKTSLLTIEIINNYTEQLKMSIMSWDMDDIHLTKDIKPNLMQMKALDELSKTRRIGVNKALVIAATGSGKTFLAAFDVRSFNPNKVLFVVHRETILKDALRTFKYVLRTDYNYGYLTGNQKDYDSDILFATNITLSKNISKFDSKYFDYIIIDEVHHAKASSYQSILDHFEPKFLLGLTATPERTEDEDAIYNIFEYNVPFEMRLNEALKYQLVAPFHYYGIRDQLINYDRNDAKQIISEMVMTDHIDKIAFEIENHKPNDKLKCIGFCIDVNHAIEMSEAMNKAGYNTIPLTGRDSVELRLSAFKELQNEQSDLEIIFTVDILNEGVDIPRLNMLLFLRPTDSPIVFLQQLGRGLRKVEGKNYVTVLDFIGNSYKRSIQIARALGSLSPHGIIEKNTLIDMIANNFKSVDLPDVRIFIDQLSKEEIIEYIKKTNFNKFEFLQSDYKNFKKYIGRDSPPLHVDYFIHEVSPDINRFIQSKIENKKIKSYYSFLKYMGEDMFEVTNDELNFIEFVSSILPLVRPEDYLIIQHLFQNKVSTLSNIEKYIVDQGYYSRSFHIESALRNINSSNYLVNENGFVKLKILFENSQFVDYINDLLEYGLLDYNRRFLDNKDTFKLYQRYRNEQVMLLISKGSTATWQKGTKIEDDRIYIFVNLKKQKNTEEHLNYIDGFKSDKIFRWESETKTTFDKHKGLIGDKPAYLFVRKQHEEDNITLPFLYIGIGRLTNPTVNNDNPGKTLLFDIVLDNSIPNEFKEELGVPNE